MVTLIAPKLKLGTTKDIADVNVYGLFAPPMVTVTRLTTGEAPCD
jgi:hypothetical protein